MKIELPKKVLFIINNLQLHGYDDFGKAGRDKKAVPQDD